MERDGYTRKETSERHLSMQKETCGYGKRQIWTKRDLEKTYLGNKRPVNKIRGLGKKLICYRRDLCVCTEIYILPEIYTPHFTDLCVCTAAISRLLKMIGLFCRMSSL